MSTTTIRRNRSTGRPKVLMAGAAALALAFVAACGNGDEGGESDEGDDPAAEESADEYAHPQVVADLEGARQSVLDGLEEFGDDQTQFFLADDVSAPEQNYGMWVLPVERSEETSYMTQQLELNDGNFEIEAEAAEDGTTYWIDQDGEITVED
ncbi:hypothetical protein [Bogoriella caseilytica]|uniref:Uncharacterized protein n=1 Tax=Bogoriella caseilytica TaxID=56055 RepID=A0A3N2BF64_9MICO|nr:hypothetical protein [Bogoriella caseilytica]ROR73901.1 hypothetical protein EDD31_2294 [Bogoriella caseilytica]